jgi:hypothetical protein
MKEKKLTIEELNKKIIEAVNIEAKEHGNDNFMKAYEKTMEIIEKNRTEFTNQQIKFEPTRLNRFLVKFPEEFGLPQWSVNSITMPKLIGKNKWDDIKVKLINFIDPSANKHIYHNVIPNKKFDFTIEFLDPTGVEVQKFTITVKSVKSIDFGGLLSYGDDGIVYSTIIFKIKKCILNF